MKVDHLTDEHIQTFLLEEIKDDSVTKHIEVCAICQAKLIEYESMINGISNLVPEVFSFDVSAVVLKKITELEYQKEKRGSMLLYIGLSIFFIVCLVVLYPYIKSIFISFNSLSSIKSLIITVSVMGFVFYLLNDLLRQYKHKEMLISQ